MNKFENARTKYKPRITKLLFIAEAPPKKNSNRFFYFDKVSAQDSLFLEMMKTLYPKDLLNMRTAEIREAKKCFLLKFQKDGFYLIDSLIKPFDRELTTTQKVELIKKGQKSLLSKIKLITIKNTKVVLISAAVFRANLKFLLDNDVNVIHQKFINFPGSGHQKEFRANLARLLLN